MIPQYNQRSCQPSALSAPQLVVGRLSPLGGPLRALIVSRRVRSRRAVRGVQCRLGHARLGLFGVRFAPNQNATSFVFNNFLSSFPRFCVFVANLRLPVSDGPSSCLPHSVNLSV